MRDDHIERSHRALLAMAVLGGLVCALPTSTFAAVYARRNEIADLLER